MDVASIGALLGSIKTATDIAKFVRESDLSVERAELRLKLAELIAALADAKINAAEVQQTIVEREQTIRELQEAARIRAAMRWEQPCYFMKNEEGVDEPFCQTCYDSAAQIVRLHTDGKGFFHCRVCKQTFKTLERASTDKTAQDLLMRRPSGTLY